MKYETPNLFTASDVESLNPETTETWIKTRFYEGHASVVEKQDWLVDRIAPPFIEPSQIQRYISDIEDKPNVLHLGMGDGSANEYFKSRTREHTSVSYADRIYVDPYHIICAFLERQKPSSGDQEKSTLRSVASILRNEFLIPSSMNDVTSGFLMERKFSQFSDKDIQIRKIRAQHQNTASDYGRDQSFGDFKTLVDCLTKRPDLLLPEDRKRRRYISPLGKSIRNDVAITDDERNLLDDIERRIDSYFPSGSEDINHVLYERLNRMLSMCDYIVADDFMNFQRHLEKIELRYHLIEGIRSDAFLKGRVYEFISGISEFLDEDSGVFVSDGAVSSYDYRLHYRELKNFLSSTADKLNVEFYVRNELPKDVPPTFLSGLRVSKKAAKKSAKRLVPANGYSVLPASEIFQSIQAKQQMAWTCLYEFVENVNNTHTYQSAKRAYIDIDSMSSDAINRIVSDLVERFGDSIYEKYEDGDLNRDIDKKIQTELTGCFDITPLLRS